jgi:hypothetical protein
MSIPLPHHPSLDFERKRAKKLLRALHSGDTDALQRARAIATTPFRLADAQLIIAREYGFASWPKLVAYFETWRAHDRAGPQFESYPIEQYIKHADHIVEHHAMGGRRFSGAIAAFIPRLYGATDDEILQAKLTREDGRHIIARMHRFPHWDALAARAPKHGMTDEEREAHREAHSPLIALAEALERADLDAVKQLAKAHPEYFVATRKTWGAAGLLDISTALWDALLIEGKDPTPEKQAATAWVLEQGGNLQDGLNAMITCAFRTQRHPVAYYLQKGADPNFVASSGIPVIEIAIMRYWNGEAVDLIARRVTPRKAFWIAAGLGDLAEFNSCFSRDGKLRKDAHERRPDFMSVGLRTPTRPGATDHELLWEAFYVAGANQRFNILDRMLEMGFPIDAAPWGGTLLEWAEGNQITSTVEYLKARGARH